jgi:hypothetical protein
MNIVHTTKAVKAFVLCMAVSSLVSCQNTAEMAQMLAPEESAGQGKAVQTAQEQHGSRAEAMATLANLSPAEREQKIREILLKPEFKEMTAGLEELARAVAVAVEDADVRNRIYERCMEKFDGETNVLWKHLEADTKVRGKAGLSWNARVESVLQKSGNARTMNAVGGVGRGVERFEKVIDAPLHLFWMYPSKWDGKTTPLVAFVSCDQRYPSLQYITAFDSKGSSSKIMNDTNLIKKRPIVVITFNERTDIQGRIKENLLRLSGNTNKLKVKLDPSFGNSTLNAPPCQLYITCHTIETANIREQWPWDGQPEFEYYASILGESYQGQPTAQDIGFKYIGWSNAVHSVQVKYKICSYDGVTGLPSSFTPQQVIFKIYEDNGWDMFDRWLTDQTVQLGYYVTNITVGGNINSAGEFVQGIYSVTPN